MSEKIDRQLVIDICLGSSCFCRGNNRNVEVIRDFIESVTGKRPCELKGHRCRNDCNHGPNLAVEGKEYHDVDPVTLLGLLWSMDNSAPE